MIYACLPSLKEQTAITRFLDETSSKINAAIDQAQREIKLFREYRERLISDVVTGKLDVREAVATLPQKEDKPASIDHSDNLTDSVKPLGDIESAISGAVP